MILVFQDRDGHEHQEMGTGNSSCFYDQEVDITDFAAELIRQKKRIVVRTGRIEVSDEVEPLHAHAGYTFGFVLSGAGRIMGEKGKKYLGPGDRFAFGPRIPHLSVADPHRTLIEGIVFIGEAGDRQGIVPAQ